MDDAPVFLCSCFRKRYAQAHYDSGILVMFSAPLFGYGPCKLFRGLRTEPADDTVLASIPHVTRHMMPAICHAWRHLDPEGIAMPNHSMKYKEDVAVGRLKAAEEIGQKGRMFLSDRRLSMPLDSSHMHDDITAPSL